MGVLLAIVALAVACAVTGRAALERRTAARAWSDTVLHALVVVTEPLYAPVRTVLAPVAASGIGIDPAPAIVLAACLFVAAAGL